MNKKVIILIAIFISIIFTFKYYTSEEKIEKRAYNDVIKELQVNNNPTGMLGATWFMTQQEVKNLFNDSYQLDIPSQQKFIIDMYKQVTILKIIN